MPSSRVTGHNLGPVGPHGGPALLAHVLGHDEHHAVAPDGSRHGQRDTGIATGGFNQRIPGLDFAPPFGFPDHAHGRAVLHRAGGVIALKLDQNGVRGITGQPLEPHQGRIAYIIFNGGVCHECRLLLNVTPAEHSRWSGVLASDAHDTLIRARAQPVR